MGYFPQRITRRGGLAEPKGGTLSNEPGLALAGPTPTDRCKTRDDQDRPATPGKIRGQFQPTSLKQKDPDQSMIGV